MFASVMAWPGAIAIGISLGLLGSGGSILTVPVLVYLVGQDEKVAIAGSLFIVGSIALAGSLQFIRAGFINWRSVATFGLPGMAGTYIGAAIAAYVSGLAQLALFAVVMLLASYLMLRPIKLTEGTHAPRALWKVAGDGLLVGIITGLVGVGGGFLIVPALVLLGGLSMHHAVATSLVIIALKSFSGFYKYLDVLSEQDLRLDWPVLWLITVLGIAGSIVGSRLARRVHQDRLKRWFGYFLIVMGIYILARSLPGALGFNREIMPAMRIIQLSDNYSVTMQIDPDDVEAFAHDGFRTIVCNRPDGEEYGQPTSASVQEACEEHGIAFHMIPMQGSAVSPETLRRFLDVIANADGPVLGYCRTGTRSAILWQVASQTQ